MVSGMFESLLGLISNLISNGFGAWWRPFLQMVSEYGGVCMYLFSFQISFQMGSYLLLMSMLFSFQMVSGYGGICTCSRFKRLQGLVLACSRFKSRFQWFRGLYYWKTTEIINHTNYYKYLHWFRPYAIIEVRKFENRKVQKNENFRRSNYKLVFQVWFRSNHNKNF